MSSERIGLFGGKFYPPHLGHLILASEARAQLKLNRLLWVLTPTPPHKLNQTITPVERRLAMTQLAIADNDDFELSRVELDREGPHYTVDTVKLIEEENPDADIFLLIGSDSLNDLTNWRSPADLITGSRFIGLIERPGIVPNLAGLEISIPGIGSRVQKVNVGLMDISSRMIRQKIANGEPFRYYVPESVYRYIAQHHLYQKE